jgi:uncharacterized membrane protein (DUF485 family)
MTSQQLERVQGDPRYQALIRQKTRLNWSLSAAMLVIYYGFVLLVAFAPGVLGQSLSGGATSVGMLAGVGVILLSLALTGIYVYRSNKHLDPLNEQVKQECGQ